MLNTELVHWLKLRGILIASLYVSMWGKIKLKQEIYILVLVRIWQYPPMIILRGGGKDVSQTTETESYSEILFPASHRM